MGDGDILLDVLSVQCQRLRHMFPARRRLVGSNGKCLALPNLGTDIPQQFHSREKI
jgi:hypothetical protein